MFGRKKQERELPEDCSSLLISLEKYSNQLFDNPKNTSSEKKFIETCQKLLCDDSDYEKFKKKIKRRTMIPVIDSFEILKSIYQFVIKPYKFTVDLADEDDNLAKKVKKLNSSARLYKIKGKLVLLVEKLASTKQHFNMGAEAKPPYYDELMALKASQNNLICEINNNLKMLLKDAAALGTGPYGRFKDSLIAIDKHLTSVYGSCSKKVLFHSYISEDGKDAKRLSNDIKEMRKLAKEIKHLFGLTEFKFLECFTKSGIVSTFYEFSAKDISSYDKFKKIKGDKNFISEINRELKNLLDELNKSNIRKSEHHKKQFSEINSYLTSQYESSDKEEIFDAYSDTDDGTKKLSNDINEIRKNIKNIQALFGIKDNKFLEFISENDMINSLEKTSKYVLDLPFFEDFMKIKNDENFFTSVYNSFEKLKNTIETSADIKRSRYAKSEKCHEQIIKIDDTLKKKYESCDKNKLYEFYKNKSKSKDNKELLTIISNTQSICGNIGKLFGIKDSSFLDFIKKDDFQLN